MVTTREKVFKSRLYRGVLWFVLLSMAGGTLIYSPALFRMSKQARPVVMTVNDREISVKQLQQRINQEIDRIAMLRQQYGDFAESLLALLGLGSPEEAAMQSLIQDALLDDVSDQMDIRVSPDFVLQKLHDPSFVVQELRDVVPLQVLDQRGAINMQMLKYYLNKSGQTETDFEKSIDDAMQRKLVRDIAQSTIYISDDELKDYFVKNNLKRKYQILTLSLDKYIKDAKAKPVSEQEVADFFASENSKAKRYWIPEKRSGSLWRFSPTAYGAVVTDKELDTFYQENKHKLYVDQPVRVSVRRILFKTGDAVDMQELEERIKKVQDGLAQDSTRFQELAKQYSDDKDTAKKGGLVGFIKRGDRDPAFERALFRLKADGDVSDIIQTDDGFEIIQRVERKRPTYKSFDVAKEEIRKKLSSREFNRRFNKDMKRIMNQIREDRTAFDALVADKKAKKEAIALTEKAENPTIQRLFKTKKGSWAYLVDENGDGIVITTEQVEKTHEPGLDSVKKQVQDDLYRKKATKLFDEALTNAKNKAEGVDLASLKGDFGGTFESIDWIRKIDNEKLQELDKKGLPVAELFSIDREGALASTRAGDKGYIIKIDAIEPFDQVLFDDKKAELHNELYQEKKGLVNRAFVASLYRNATINKNERLGQRQTEFPEF